MRRTFVPFGLLAAFAAAAALGGSAGTGGAGLSTAPEERAPEQIATEAPSLPAPAPSLVLTSPTPDVVYGDMLVLNGSLTPMATGREVVVEVDHGSGWIEAGRTTTQLDGTFLWELLATSGGLVRSRTLEGDAISEPVTFTVRPRVSTKRGRGIAFVGAHVSARVEPSTYAGIVQIVVKKDGTEVAHTSAFVRSGRVRARVQTPGTGRFTIVYSFPEAPGFAPTFATARVVSTGRALSAGSSGADVRALRARLAALRFHVPASSSTYTYELADAVIAFQKAHGLERTGTVGTATWRALGKAAVLEPRYKGPALHIEIDKTRQILLVVRNGEVDAVLPVSSGATGNTPEGKHQIRWKALATTTWLGPGILYRTMTFYENSVAIHGWSSVPTYPASHGCVRIPIWTADWLYNQSPVGETVYVYS